VITEDAATALGRRLERATRIAGGDINDAWLLELEGGARAFLKARPAAAPGEYAAEAAGLAWLGEAENGLAVPAVLAVDEAFLVLEWVDEGRLDAAGEEALGRGLAHLHLAGADTFGGLAPGAPEGSLRIGELALPAGTGEEWARVYAEQRLVPLLRAAVARDALPPGGAAAVEAVIDRLGELAGPPEPPARVHGDLWSGNVLARSDGTPLLIDPAAHGGHREADLAMLALFGTPSPRTVAAYAEVAPLAAGHEARVPLWQLQPLLVHAVLFGGSYGAAAMRAAQAAAA
jgi:fructosamine-3-kinase